MSDDTLLMIPGPTNVPPSVLEAIGAPTMYHRGPDFSALLERVTSTPKSTTMAE